MHDSDYISYKDFLGKSDQYRSKIFESFETTDPTDSLVELQNSFKPPDVTSALTDSDFITLHNFLRNMSKLTGLLLIMSENESETYSGTGFILKLRRQTNCPCPCPDQQGHNGDHQEHAIVTVSTAYHVFNKENKNSKRRYEKINEIWSKYKTELKLCYGKGEATLDQIQQSTRFPTLYGHKLIEMDKDLDYDCDWCAVECVTHDTTLIKRLERTLSRYQSGLKKLYHLSLMNYKDVDMVVIVGYPHNWSLRFSFGNTECPNKEELKVIRSNQLWCRYYYDNLTCKGSSGSPIFKWGQPTSGFGYWFGHSHNHAEGYPEEKGGKSTIGVENIV
ncbi:acidic repeat-containing protein-like isoform X2 [Biomphalaria pfeifferi]|uniref:Acidic repeat-containing protein-like isoform X2 n=1 Tax=Biomphalaria pfeifferi TaxID=112525 RepID=A0AAD8AX04_BIOPF|nr:acidic repeat-containing protein-like isoform X2 [Biomphalaria pfeifferi]